MSQWLSIQADLLFGTRVAETILASVHMRTRHKAGHMEASDQVKHCTTPCEEGAVHIWLMWGLRTSMPKRSMWRVAQFDTLRLRLIKIAARVVEMKTMIRIHLPTSCPGQQILHFALGRIPRLAT